MDRQMYLSFEEWAASIDSDHTTDEYDTYLDALEAEEIELREMEEFEISLIEEDL